jgi:hypothetical protein
MVVIRSMQTWLQLRPGAPVDRQLTFLTAGEGLGTIPEVGAWPKALRIGRQKFV